MGDELLDLLESQLAEAQARATLFFWHRGDGRFWQGYVASTS